MKIMDPAVIEGVSQNLITVLPLLRKRIPYRNETEHGITFSHLQVLSLLSETGSTSMSKLSSHSSIAIPSITLLVDRLIAEGLVDCVRDTEDRRTINATPIAN